MGRTPTLYSAKPKPVEIFSQVLGTLFGDVFRGEPAFLEIALRLLQQRLAKARKKA